MEQLLYNETISVKFNEGNHSYYVNGERVKSVTTIVNMLDNPQLTYWKLKQASTFLLELIDQGIVINKKHIEDSIRYHEVISGEAKDVGTVVHDYCERFSIACIKGESLPDIPQDIDYKILNGLNAFLEWYSQHDIKFLEVEKIVYSKKYNYVGKFDALANIDGVLTLIDYKTSKGIYTNQDWQLCGYKQAIEEELNIDCKPMLLHFDKENGIFTPHYVEDIENKTKIFSLMAELKNML